MLEEATRHTLICRACDTGDQAAWTEFDRIYRRFIVFILGQLGVEREDIDDLTQQIMVALTRDLPGYDRKKAGFRTWLSAVIRHAALAHLQRQRKARQRVTLAGTNPEIHGSSFNVPEIDRRIENEWATYLASLAMERVREKFQGSAMDVFERSLDGSTVESIAAETGLSVASVYTLRKRVKKRLYLEIRALIGELEP
jgi:RNA polymerase sigma-70 factor (ECF subfamily)